MMFRNVCPSNRLLEKAARMTVAGISSRKDTTGKTIRSLVTTRRSPRHTRKFANDQARVTEPNRTSRERFLGSWRLVSFEHVSPTGEVVKLFGESPNGSLLYQRDGHMSAQVSVGSPKRLTSDDLFEVSTEESAEAWRGYFGYWGSFRVDAEKGWSRIA
jgi:hypothetical protein